MSEAQKWPNRVRKVLLHLCAQMKYKGSDVGLKIPWSALAPKGPKVCVEAGLMHLQSTINKPYYKVTDMLL